MIVASPRPWKATLVAGALTEGFYYIQILDANGRKVAAVTQHPSVGGLGPEQARFDARLIVAMINSPLAEKFEAEIRGRITT